MNVTDADGALVDVTRAVRANDPEALAQRLMANVWPMFSVHFEVLSAAVESLPSSVVERYPVLRLLHRMTPVLARTTRPFKPLVYPDDVKHMSHDEVDILMLAQTVAFRVSGDVSASLIYARRLEDRLLEIRTESRERTDGPLWYYHFQIGSTLLSAGDTFRSLLALATARQFAAVSGQSDAVRIVEGRIALAHALRGSLADAEKSLDSARSQPIPTTAHLKSCASDEHTVATLIAVERMDDGMSDLVSHLEPYDSIEMSWPFALLARCRAFLALHQPENALEAVWLAADSHPAQFGAFATDVIAAVSIEAHLALGDVPAARRIADANPEAGVLSRAATARLHIHEGPVIAGDDVAGTSDDRRFGPAQRAELSVLIAWRELERTGQLDPSSASTVLRFGEEGVYRRLLATMPTHFIDAVRQALTHECAAEFDMLTAGLTFSDVQLRPRLTSSEIRVLYALSHQRTVAEVAAALHLSTNTVKTQLRFVYRKLGCSTRETAIETASRLGLIRSEPSMLVAAHGSV